MKWNITNRLALFIGACLALISFSSCHDDDDNDKHIIDSSLTGEWFYDRSTASGAHYETINLSPGGAFTGQIFKFDKVELKDEYFEGTYSYNGDIHLVYTDFHSPKQIYAVWQVINVNKYKLDVRVKSNSQHFTYHRIVDTYQMEVGDSRMCIINDSEFHAVDYHSCDTRIATIDEDGTIHAIKRGTTYIRAISSLGEAIIKVVVEDPVNVIDDYAQYVGSQISNAIADMGDGYVTSTLYDGSTFVEYFINDDLIRRVTFIYYQKVQVSSVWAYVRSRADISKIITSFDQKYYKMDIGEEGSHVYYYEYNEHVMLIEVNENEKQVTYTLQRNSIELFDGLITADIDNVAKWLGLDMTNAGQGVCNNYISNNQYYQYIHIEYDEESRAINLIKLYFNDDANIKEVIYWFENHYVVHQTSPTVRLYCLNKHFMRSEYFVFIGIDDVTGLPCVLYKKR